METKEETTRTVTIVLHGNEADWLKNQMQNPLHGQNPRDESLQDKEMRHKFWQALGGR